MINIKWRKPDEIIGERYLHRWHLIRKPGVRNLYLHRYLGSDDDRALHDHPWASWSILLWGKLIEITPQGKKRIWPLIPKYRSAEYTHRLILESNQAVTLFFTGKKVREWGFHCSNGWVHWSKLVGSDGSKATFNCKK